MSTLPITHPDSAHLADFAVGQLDPTLRLLIETHLALCATCSQTVAELSRCGSLQLAATTPVPPPPSSWSRLSQRLDRLDKTGPEVIPPAALAELDPASVLASRSTGPLHWNRLPFARGQHVAILARADEDPAPEGVTLLLGRGDSGRRFPRHRHVGSESVVVLEGGYRDPFGHWTAGSWVDYPAGSEHAPLADTDGPCLVLARLSGGARFSGLCGLALALRARVTRLRRARR